MRKWCVNKVNLSTNFSTQKLFQIRACVISTRKTKHIDITTMFTCSHANTPLGQSERMYYLSFFCKVVYAMCYSVIKRCGYWTSETLSVLVSNRNTLYNVLGVKRYMPVDLPESESISGAEINLTVCAVSNGVVCWEQICVEDVHLSQIGTYCISCVVQQRTRVKDLCFLVGYSHSL